jgi:predicted dehydrogenase
MGIKIGLVGLGSFGSCFAHLFTAHPLVDAVALCDAQPEKLRNWKGNLAYSGKLADKDVFESFDDICRSDCDALAIITQPWLHAPQAIQAMESGKDVYSAVPVICLPDDDEMLDWCQKIIDCSLRTGKHYMLGETTYYRPQTMFCRRKYLAGEFGDVVYAAAEYAHDLDSPCSLRQVNRSRTTGVIGSQAAAIMQRYYDRGLKDHPMAYPTHSVSGPLVVMDTHAVKVSAYGTRNQFGAEDPFFASYDFSNIVALFKLANGVPFRVGEMREICYNTGLRGEDFRMYGTRGSYAYNEFRDNGRTSFTTYRKWNAERKLTDEEMRDPLPEDVVEAYKKVLQPDAKPGDDFVPQGHGGSHPYLANEFVTSVFEHRRPAIDAWKAASYMAMGVAAHQSAQKDGELVKVVDFGRPKNESLS